MMTTTNPQVYNEEYSMQQKLDSPTWFTYSGASHHLTCFDSIIQHKSTYLENDIVHIGNDQSLSIKFIGLSCFDSHYTPDTKLTLKQIIHHDITRKLSLLLKLTIVSFFSFLLTSIL